MSHVSPYNSAMTAAQTTMPQPHRFTVDEFHRLVEVGMLHAKDRVELINGEIIHMSPIGSRHNATVARLTEHFHKLGTRVTLWVQGSVALAQYDEPQPDIGLLKRKADFYESANPEAQDIYLLIEVADSSLIHDLNVKRRYYASHGVRELWVVDAVNKVIHVYRGLRDGEYQDVSQVSGEQTLAPHAFPDFVGNVRQMIG